jgi:hypothetical protein
VNDVTWYVLGLMLTGIGLLLSYRAYQRKGVVAGVRGVGWSLLPLALALTGTLELAGDITDDVGRWATHLVFSPLVWLGIALAGVSVVLLGASGWLAARGIGGGEPRPQKQSDKSLPGSASRGPAAPVDDDMADIEAILRKHGIQ